MKRYRVNYTEAGWKRTAPDYPDAGEHQTVIQPVYTCRLVVDLLRPAPGAPPRIETVVLEEPSCMDAERYLWQSTVILGPENVELVPA